MRRLLFLGFVLSALIVGLAGCGQVTKRDGARPAKHARASTSTGGGGGDGTIGTLAYQENFVNPTSPIVNTTGGSVSHPQAGNFGFKPTGGTMVGNIGKWFGNWYPGPGKTTLPSLAGATNYADLNMNVPGRCPTTTGSCGLEGVDHSGPHYSTNQVGQTTYESQAFYVPAGGLKINNSGANVEIRELHFANLVNGAPVRLGLYPNHVTIYLDTGQCTGHGGSPQYHSNADAPGQHPAGSIELPGLYAIPPGKIVAGTWNEIVLRVNWETAKTGSVTAWYRTPGATWVQGSQIAGIPTTQYLKGQQPPNTWNDSPMTYSYAMKSALDLDEAGYSDGTGFQSVANTTP